MIETFTRSNSIQGYLNYFNQTLGTGMSLKYNPAMFWSTSSYQKEHSRLKKELELNFEALRGVKEFDTNKHHINVYYFTFRQRKTIMLK